MSLWSTVSTLHFVTCNFVTCVRAKGVSSPQETGIYWPFLISVLLPSVLDLTLSAILLHYLTRAMKQVYAAHTRRRISRLVNIIWQSALPPTLCAVCMSVFYIRYTTVPQGDLPFWFPVIQAMIGKLYVLSFLYMVNSQPLQSDKRPTTFISTLTVPTEIMYPRTRDARADTVCSEIIVAERGRIFLVHVPPPKFPSLGLTGPWAQGSSAPSESVIQYRVHVHIGKPDDTSLLRQLPATTASDSMKEQGHNMRTYAMPRLPQAIDTGVNVFFHAWMPAAISALSIAYDASVLPVFHLTTTTTTT
ncbi:hypothetical protein BJY52DRAFT_1216092 [Lactarius psammicola]|nr:hypothetical protein BJY52DRAFT_1216092 [Lactarius psammicola]